MNIFGIGPIEFLIIIALGLVIFGPERLPGIGRQVGKMVARVLAWQYTSPEAQLLMEIRRDLEKEITDIRDEMIRARQSLDIRPELQQTLVEAQQAVRDAQGAAQEAAREAEVAIRAPHGATVAAPAPNAALLNPPAPPVDDLSVEIVSPSGEPLLDIEPPPPAALVSPSGETLLEVARPAETLSLAPDFTDFPAPPLIIPPAQQFAAPDFTDFPAPPLIIPPALTASAPVEPKPYVNGSAAPAANADYELLVMQVRALANEVADLREQLRRSGVLDGGLQPVAASRNGRHAEESVAVSD